MQYVVLLNRAPCQYLITAAEHEQPGLRIDPIAKVHLKMGEFDTTLPPVSLTIFSTFHLAHTRPGIIVD